MIRRQSRSGFTFVELCLGLVITALVMSALAAFSMAMTTAWSSAEKGQAISLKSNLAVMRIQNEIRDARLLGAVRAGSSTGASTGAAIMIWKKDTSGDGFIQGSEVSMIEHDTVNHTLKLYPLGQADGAGTWSYSTQFTNSTIFQAFKTNRTSVTLANDVYGAVFETTGTSGTSRNPTLHFGLKLKVDDRQAANPNSRAVGGAAVVMAQYGSATVRAPIAQPGN